MAILPSHPKGSTTCRAWAVGSRARRSVRWRERRSAQQWATMDTTGIIMGTTRGWGHP